MPEGPLDLGEVAVAHRRAFHGVDAVEVGLLVAHLNQLALAPARVQHDRHTRLFRHARQALDRGQAQLPGDHRSLERDGPRAAEDDEIGPFVEHHLHLHGEHPVLHVPDLEDPVVTVRVPLRGLLDAAVQPHVGPVLEAGVADVHAEGAAFAQRSPLLPQQRRVARDGRGEERLHQVPLPVEVLHGLAGQRGRVGAVVDPFFLERQAAHPPVPGDDLAVVDLARSPRWPRICRPGTGTPCRRR